MSAHCSSYAAPNGVLFHFVVRLLAEHELRPLDLARPTPSCTGPIVDDVFAAVATLLQSAARGELQRVPASTFLERA